MLRDFITQNGIFCLFLLTIRVQGLELPNSCQAGEYYEPGVMECLQCPVNTSMVTSLDGFGCACEDHSITVNPLRCKPCGATEVVSNDGRSCVPRRCQSVNGKVVCRRCPADFIQVTQNLDGSLMKEVQCIKCARGYRAENNRCVRCEACVCARSDAVVAGKCVPKKFFNDRPKYEENSIHPSVLLEAVKNEYLCLQRDVRACRTLANICVRTLYSTDTAGPCRFWIQPKFTPPKGLPQLTVEASTMEKTPGELTVEKRTKNLTIAVIKHKSDGAMEIFNNPNRNLINCMLPVNILVGVDFSWHCSLNVSEVESEYFDSTLSPYLYVNGTYKAIPVSIRKNNDRYVQRGTWPTTKFRRFFFIDKSLSIVTNTTNTIYLRNLIVYIQTKREATKSGSLSLRISVEAQYATKSALSSVVATSLTVDNDLPSAGVLRGMEIWGGVLGSFLSLYAIIQWRGAMRRGGHQATLLPLLSGSISDALYFAAWFSTLHALAAEATLGLTLPLSKSEDNIVHAFVYSALCLKAIKVAWINWKQCRCDIFFLDWAEYNPPLKGPEQSIDKSSSWKSEFLASEWCAMQTKRRANPAYTVTLTLVILQLMSTWQSQLPPSTSYQWAIATIAWISSYVVNIAIRWILDKVLGSPTLKLPKICSGIEMSLLVFQEDYYVLYVHGRNEDCDTRTIVGPLSTCRILCAPQLRAIYKQLSSNRGLVNLGESDTKQALLSQFLAAFFERALDGLSWVASERTVLEKLLDVELVIRENGNTSALLYDSDMESVSCFAMTWWGEEWNLGTFDAMLFSSIFIATHNSLPAALGSLVIWQMMEKIQWWFGNKNVRKKTNTY